MEDPPNDLCDAGAAGGVHDLRLRPGHPRTIQLRPRHSDERQDAAWEPVVLHVIAAQVRLFFFRCDTSKNYFEKWQFLSCIFCNCSLLYILFVFPESPELYL